MNTASRISLCLLVVIFVILIVLINGTLWAPFILLEKFTQNWISAIILFGFLIVVSFKAIFK